LRREYDRLRFLRHSGEGVRSSLDLADVLGQLAREAATIARGQLGLVTLVDDGTSDLVLRARYDRRKNVSTQHSRKIEEWFLRRSVATGKTIVTAEPAAHYESVFGYEAPHGATAAILCVPMAVHDRVVGVISVFRPTQSGQFEPVEVSLVEEMASQAAMAVEQASLFSMVKAYAHRLEQSYDTTLKVLMAALDAKDHSTEGHSERVAGLTVVTAREMGVAEEQILDIERGALLHDVGKIGVPDAVLRKRGSLSRQEWESMQKHPLLAGLMVSKVEFLEGALPILLYHHEHYDGSGYPFGLVGDRIPLAARVFSVVDAYDAMTSRRPYRAALSHEEAMKEIRAQAGRQFDPEVTAVFERIMAERLGLHGEEAEKPAA
jgi:HD-GYP domain-containing protein (c-di-GMP phosphodiesterase class II)